MKFLLSPIARNTSCSSPAAVVQHQCAFVCVGLYQVFKQRNGLLGGVGVAIVGIGYPNNGRRVPRSRVYNRGLYVQRRSFQYLIPATTRLVRVRLAVFHDRAVLRYAITKHGYIFMFFSRLPLQNAKVSSDGLFPDPAVLEMLQVAVDTELS